MRLIDADVLGRYLNDWQLSNATNEHEVEYSLIEMFMHILDTQPTIDAVPVVRCKDCIWYTPISETCDWTSTDCTKTFREQNDFCSYGERREDNHD